MGSKNLNNHLLTCSELEFYDANYDELEYKQNVLNNISILEEKTDSCSLFKLGCLHYHIDNNEKARECFEKCINLNNLYGYVGLYELTHDKTYLETASNLNNILAQRELGLKYKQYYNIEKSIEYLEKSADQGDKESIISLSSLFIEEDSSYYNPEKLLKYRLKLGEEKQIELKKPYNKYIQFIESKLKNLESEEITRLNNKIKDLEMELSLIPEYGEFYKQSKENFENNIKLIEE